MTTIEKFIQRLDNRIAMNQKIGIKALHYTRRVSTKTDDDLAGIQILLPPTAEQEGRLLYISTSMKILFGQLATIPGAEDCAALGIPKESPDYAGAGKCGAYKAVGKKGLSRLGMMATDPNRLRSVTLNSKTPGIEPLGGTELEAIQRDYEATEASTENDTDDADDMDAALVTYPNAEPANCIFTTIQREVIVAHCLWNLQPRDSLRVFLTHSSGDYLTIRVIGNAIAGRKATGEISMRIPSSEALRVLDRGEDPAQRQIAAGGYTDILSHVFRDEPIVMFSVRK